jgi:hypothetical protein
VLQVPPQNPEIHRPAVGGSPEFVVHDGPSHVTEADDGPAVARLEFERDPGGLPVVVGTGQLKLEFIVGDTQRATFASQLCSGPKKSL